MIDKLSEFIVKKRKAIGIFFVFLCVLSIILMQKVVINYDLSSYLPENMPSKQALTVAEDEFGMQSTAEIMVNNVTMPEAKVIKEQIEDVEGVYTVLWLDDSYDVYQPESFIDAETIDKYYKDGSAKFDIMFDEGDYSELTYTAVEKIEEILPEDSNFIGAAVDTKNSRSKLQSEMVTIMAFLIPLTLIILLLTTDSYFSSLIFIAVIGVSILLNMGSNVIFKNVSFITFSIAAALQFAVSMDYSVFLLHQFESEKNNYDTTDDAMKAAVKNAIKSIFSSSLTTIAGFVALAFMSFGIGKDIGFVFAKGIIFSLLCVIFLMPYFIMTFNKLIEKTKHKRFLTSFDTFARYTVKFGKLLIILAMIVIIPSYVASKNNDFTYGTASFGSGPGTKAYEDEQKIVAKFGRSNPIMLIVPNVDYYTEKCLVDEYENLDIVDNVLTLVNQVPEGVPYSFIDQDTYSKFQNEDHTRIVVYVRTSSESDLAVDALNQVLDITKKYYGDDFYYTGTIPVTIDMKTSIESDYNIVNWISILAIVVILIFTFKSLIIPIILTIIIEAGIFINMGIPYFADESLIFLGYLIVSSIELGATIDYAILMTNNYIKFRKTHNKYEATVTAIKESLPSIITSGAILVIAGYILKFISSLKAVSDMGELIGRGALISVILVVVVLPQLLALFDKLVVKAKDSVEYTEEADEKYRKSLVDRAKARYKRRVEALKRRREQLKNWAKTRKAKFEEEDKKHKEQIKARKEADSKERHKIEHSKKKRK